MSAPRNNIGIDRMRASGAIPRRAGPFWQRDAV
jgi:hypothetical protein